MTRRQCAKCPWKVTTDPRTIPHGYRVDMHRALANTIADPERPNLHGSLRIMACHESPIGGELPCVGWLDHQLGHGNNIALRFAVHTGRVSADYELDGEQHACFEDTLP